MYVPMIEMPGFVVEISLQRHCHSVLISDPFPDGTENEFFMNL